MERKHWGYFAIALAVLVTLVILDRTYLQDLREMEPKTATTVPIFEGLDLEPESPPRPKPTIDEEEEE